ncbi:MAG: hypothetical protein WDO24_05735 [Pseudomonadota bacterium]
MDGQPALVYTGKVYDAELVRVTEGSILNNDAIVAQTPPLQHRRRGPPGRPEPGQQPDLQAVRPAQGFRQASRVAPQPPHGSSQRG